MWNRTSLALFVLVVPGLANAQDPPAADPPTVDANTVQNYQPEPGRLTESQQWHDYLFSFVSPIALVGAATGAGLGQWRDTPKEWGEGGQAYALRFVSGYGQHVVSSTLLFAGSSLLHEDNRYISSGRSTFGDRLKYSVMSPFLTRHFDADGSSHRRVAVSRLLAFAGAAAVSRLWQPRSSGNVHSGAISFAATLGATAGFDVASEFLHLNLK